MNDKEKFKRWTPIPKNLTPEEEKLWEEELEWQEQEKARRKKQGFYKQKPKKQRIGWKTIKNIFKKDKKW